MRENTKSEDNLFQAMMTLWEMFNDDGTALKGSLREYLGIKKVPLKNYVSQILEKNKIVDKTRSGKSWLIFWNWTKPTPELAQIVLEEARSLKDHKTASPIKKKVDEMVQEISEQRDPMEITLLEKITAEYEKVQEELSIIEQKFNRLKIIRQWIEENSKR